jgi:hypothetical protein
MFRGVYTAMLGGLFLVSHKHAYSSRVDEFIFAFVLAHGFLVFVEVAFVSPHPYMIDSWLFARECLFRTDPPAVQLQLVICAVPNVAICLSSFVPEFQRQICLLQ